ncbi:unnamed protein product [Didymodactylos carnosus]|uniref:Uncharacterized protein n=1 Tax=Didymodactylos carnosus TaxID=1234261 RepID=A0A8S2SPX0_9BILA|nr:unnamed protein product [Didymodactylos carnosus]CAF4234688.1 unnamed protein product [Didymodactylos carnosus]
MSCLIFNGSYGTIKSRANDKYKWRCREKGCKLTRSIRDVTFFSGSKLEIQHVLDLMFYWSQGVDIHDFLRRHCKFASESTIASRGDWWCWACGGNRRKFMDETQIQSRSGCEESVGTTIYSDEWQSTHKILKICGCVPKEKTKV